MKIYAYLVAVGVFQIISLFGSTLGDRVTGNLPVNIPVETPVKVPVETPVKVPVEVPVKAPVEPAKSGLSFVDVMRITTCILGGCFPVTDPTKHATCVSECTPLCTGDCADCVVECGTTVNLKTMICVPTCLHKKINTPPVVPVASPELLSKMSECIRTDCFPITDNTARATCVAKCSPLCITDCATCVIRCGTGPDPTTMGCVPECLQSTAYPQNPPPVPVEDPVGPAELLPKMTGCILNTCLPIADPIARATCVAECAPLCIKNECATCVIDSGTVNDATTMGRIPVCLQSAYPQNAPQTASV